MTEVILHHYPQSPVTEKVRVAFGLKGIDWHSVTIPRIPPKPDLMPLTGGYRRTPVMQVGADIYCDSSCILREIDRRYPEPTFYPGGGYGLPWALGQWTDNVLFELVLRLVLGHAPDELPKEFAADRGRLYFGPDHDLKAVQAGLPHTLAQLRAHLGWLNDRLAHGRDFILGEPGLPDVFAYYNIWFLRGRWPEGPQFLSQFPALVAWEERVKALGHGRPADMEASAALEIAKGAEPETGEQADPGDPQGLKPGMAIRSRPMGDGGDPDVEGEIRHVSADTVAIAHENARVGRICIHFPRVGYEITPL